MNSLSNKIFGIASDSDFDELCMEVFRLQAGNCNVYREYLEMTGCNPADVKSIKQIPFLPIRFFKSRKVVTELQMRENEEFPKEEILFTSSATTGMVPSKHYVTDPEIYRRSFTEGFRIFYGEPRQYAILSLLPSYLERKGSSLIYMAEHLMRLTGNSASGFYLYNYGELAERLNELKAQGTKTILLGVTFALLDFVKEYKIDFPDLTIIETGGMKGRGKEISRNELHKVLCEGFGVGEIHSEYGMAELLSQAYSKGRGVFLTPPWMKIVIRELYNPFSYPDGYNITGGINIIDLANVNSCSFIETEDMGRITEKGFELLGRLKDAELRGCNMLLE